MLKYKIDEIDLLELWTDILSECDKRTLIILSNFLNETYNHLESIKNDEDIIKKEKFGDGKFFDYFIYNNSKLGLTLFPHYFVEGIIDDINNSHSLEYISLRKLFDKALYDLFNILKKNSFKIAIVNTDDNTRKIVDNILEIPFLDKLELYLSVIKKAILEYTNPVNKEENSIDVVKELENIVKDEEELVTLKELVKINQEENNN